ncbi:MAG TPA: hypothetical protein VFZ97_12640 [Acidimicrobiales bacterium]
MALPQGGYMFPNAEYVAASLPFAAVVLCFATRWLGVATILAMG